MKFKESLRMALSDLGRRKGRTILTSLGITIGTILIVTMVGLGTGVKNFMLDTVNDEDSVREIQVAPYKYYDDDNEDMETMDQSEFQDKYGKVIDDNFINELKDTGMVDNITSEIRFYPSQIRYEGKDYSGQLSCIGFNKDAQVFADSEIERVKKDKNDDSLKPLKAGTTLNPNDGEIVVGEQIVDGLGISDEEILNKEIEITINKAAEIKIEPVSKKFKVVGVVDKNFQYGDKFLLSTKDAAELKGYSTLQTDYLNNVGYDMLYVYAKDVNDVKDLSNKIEDLDYKYASVIESANSFKELINNVNMAFAIFGVIVLVVAAIGVVNTMSMSVIERTKSIGIMKALGANSANIKQIFLVQSSLIGLIGGCVGVLIGSGINSLIEIFIGSKLSESVMTSSLSVGLSWDLKIIVIAVTVVIALISGIYPASKASKMDPIKALTR